MTDMTHTDPQPVTGPMRRALRAALVMSALVVAADLLLFGPAPGLNLYVFAAAIVIGIVLVQAGRLRREPMSTLLPLCFFAALPLLEAPSVLGVLLTLLSLALLTLGTKGLIPRRLSQLPLVLFRFAILGPLRFADDATKLVSRGVAHRLGRILARGIVVWIVPAVCALIFLVLFASANPLIEDVLDQIDPSTLLNLLNPERTLFWLVIAAVVWPLLLPRLMRWRKLRTEQAIEAPQKSDNPLFGRAAILRSLLVFNAMFAVQSTLDLTYLWGGAELPEGMSHADYAHRGAYPLIVTALLAAAFVLAAMRRNGPGENSALIRGLVYAWIAQNILLCISSILRLDLYVEVYSLTELRLAAGIWMGLVAVGLALILLRIALRRSNAWLVSMNLAGLVLTLYVCAYIDFAALIARFNVEHSLEISGAGMSLDTGYLGRLGPSAIPALDMYLDAVDTRAHIRRHAVETRQDLIEELSAAPLDWRSWNFRGWRLQQYVLARSAVATSPANHDN